MKRKIGVVVAGALVFCGVMSVPAVTCLIGYSAGLEEGLNHPHKYRPVSTTQWVEKESR